jgi:hypothetical protein
LILAKLFSNREPAPDAYPLLLHSDPNSCMPVWAAARCTSAAWPYFKAFEWQGQLLFDGGIQVNCPAAASFSEGKSIWPGQRCDILLSLGTGQLATQTTSPSTYSWWSQTSRILEQLVAASTNPEVAWDKFVATLPPGDRRFLRLNPVNEEPEFNFDAVDKLDEIEKQAGTWLLRCPEVEEVCKRLIASLFFFVFMPVNDNILTGTICCRLPIDLTARRRLLETMLTESNLFMVNLVDRNTEPPIIVVTESLQGALLDRELHIPVELRGLPEEGEVAVQIKMKGFGQDGRDATNWTHISGSPYIARERSF